jgi:ferredoxin
MVIAEIKPIEEIYDMVRGYRTVLNLGCGGCTAVCLAGGQKEVDGLNTKLKLLFKKNNDTASIRGLTIERQCEDNFFDDVDSVIDGFDAVLSMACGAGVQFLAERYPHKPVFPAVNTTFVGVTREVGWYEERCSCCGECVLGMTGGVCPVTMCAKSLFNGPCGGAQDGHCEVDPEIPCAWSTIYERLRQQNRLEDIYRIHPARQWQNQIQGRLVLNGYKKRYEKDSE